MVRNTTRCISYTEKGNFQLFLNRHRVCRFIWLFLFFLQQNTSLLIYSHGVFIDTSPSTKTTLLVTVTGPHVVLVGAIVVYPQRGSRSLNNIFWFDDVHLILFAPVSNLAWVGKASLFSFGIVATYLECCNTVAMQTEKVSTSVRTVGETRFVFPMIGIHASHGDETRYNNLYRRGFFNLIEGSMKNGNILLHLSTF